MHTCRHLGTHARLTLGGTALTTRDWQHPTGNCQDLARFVICPTHDMPRSVICLSLSRGCNRIEANIFVLPSPTSCVQSLFCVVCVNFVGIGVCFVTKASDDISSRPGLVPLFMRAADCYLQAPLVSVLEPFFVSLVSTRCFRNRFKVVVFSRT